MLIFLIILGIIIYLLIAWAVFRICAANDTFSEFSSIKIYSFPTATFSFSLLWLIGIPFSIICAIFCWIAEEIEAWGYAYYMRGEEKRLSKITKKRKEEK